MNKLPVIQVDELVEELPLIEVSTIQTHVVASSPFVWLFSVNEQPVVVKGLTFFTKAAATKEAVAQYLEFMAQRALDQQARIEQLNDDDQREAA